MSIYYHYASDLPIAFGISKQITMNHNFMPSFFLACYLWNNGKRIISASEDRTLRVWDLESGEVIAVFTDEGELETCTITPD